LGGRGVAEGGAFGVRVAVRVGLGVAGTVHAIRIAMRSLMIIKHTLADLVNEPPKYNVLPLLLATLECILI